MSHREFDRASLRVCATLLLAGQLAYIVVTLFHAGGNANDHPAIFTEYASSGNWTLVHVGQFACMTVFIAGLFGLFFTLDFPTAMGRWASRFGAALATATLALYGAVLAVDGVALKQAVNAWASAPNAEKAARFASAESIRWLEWGLRSYQNFTLCLTVLVLAVAVARTAWIPRLVACLIALSGAAYLVQGWTAGLEGFSPWHTTAIVSGEVVNMAWIIALLLIAWRGQDSR